MISLLIKADRLAIVNGYLFIFVESQDCKIDDLNSIDPAAVEQQQSIGAVFATDCRLIR